MSLSKEYRFQAALPVWKKGEQTEMNKTLIFRGIVQKADGVRLCLTASSKYQIFINGAFFADGPARTAHGYYRVDERDITKALTMKINCVCILAAGYNCNSFYLTDEPSFVCAELMKNDEVLYATGTDKPFEVTEFTNRVQKVPRYSFQRPFTESYVLDGCYDVYFNDPDLTYPQIETQICKDKHFLERGVPYGEYTPLAAKKSIARGIMLPRTEKTPYDNRSYVGIGETLKGYPVGELTADNIAEVSGYEACIKDKTEYAFSPVNLDTNCFEVFDMGLNTTGFLRLSFTALHDTVVYAVFDEKLGRDGVPQAGSNGCINIVSWAVQGGRAYDLVSFEPYTFRYVQVISMYAPILLTHASVYKEEYNRSLLTGLKTMPDENLQEIYNAALESFCQNATDIFMDCPSRERAGWLCDSFFTSRVEYALTGKARVERNFLENFLLPESFRCLPEGMLPMCYPADHYDGTYIPNWAMWYVLELKEYLQRSGDTELVERAKEKVYDLAAFFKKYENADGLLSKLDSWVFVEWSKANELTQDINYPTNMLYAMFSDAVGSLYGDEAFKEQAEKLRQTIREKAFDGAYFIDNAVINENGIAENTKNHTETCQYYAFFSGVATKESYPDLWNSLVTVFGPGRNDKEVCPDVPISNAFIGNYLRLQLLFDRGMYDEVIREIREFFTPMAKATGTLWENMTSCASCCHGFASHVIYWLNQILS